MSQGRRLLRGFRLFRLGIEELHGHRRHDRRNRMLVDKLRVRIATKQHAKIVEPRHDTLQLHADDEKDGDGGLVLANLIEKDVLNRSEERRGGKECGCTCRSRWWLYD